MAKALMLLIALTCATPIVEAQATSTESEVQATREIARYRRGKKRRRGRHHRRHSRRHHRRYWR